MTERKTAMIHSNQLTFAAAFLCSTAWFCTISVSRADNFAVTVDGTDAIFLAGRTDVIVPDPALPWTGPGTHLERHANPTPEEAQETMPPVVPVSGGDVIRVLDPAIGGINFFNGLGPPFFGPSGNGLAGSDLFSLDGISGYQGSEGPLTGIFLDDSIPSSGPAPATLDFSPSGLGQNFTTLAPELRQVFYIGDGVTGGGVFQEFTAPAGATRLFLGIPDGFAFDGHPGYYDDNDGSYRVFIGVNQIPDIPEPSSIAITLIAFVGLVSIRRSLLHF